MLRHGYATLASQIQRCRFDSYYIDVVVVAIELCNPEAAIMFQRQFRSSTAGMGSATERKCCASFRLRNRDIAVDLVQRLQDLTR